MILIYLLITFCISLAYTYFVQKNEMDRTRFYVSRWEYVKDLMLFFFVMWAFAPIAVCVDIYFRLLPFFDNSDGSSPNK